MDMKGVIIPAVTPFDGSGQIRYDWMEENYRRWNETDVCGIMALGTNGEFRSLDDEESFRVIEAASKWTSPDKVFIAGIGRESLHQTLAFLKRLEEAELRIDYVSVLTPCYFKKSMTAKALIAYFTEIADKSKAPVLLYSAPGYANGVEISPDALAVLARHPNIAGIKDTSKDCMIPYMEETEGIAGFEVIAGSVGNVLTCMKRGGKIGFLSGANYFPATCAKLMELGEKEGTSSEIVSAYYDKLAALLKETGGSFSVAGVKETMNLMGFKGGVPRLPVLPCDEAEEACIREGIAKWREFILD